MDTTLYYATMNILDYLALHENLNEETESKLYTILDYLNMVGKIDIPSLADANDCGQCKTYSEVVVKLRELFKSGDRITLN